MAKKYIDAESFRRKMFEETFLKDSDEQKWDSGCWIRYGLFERCLEKESPADVRKNERGKWILETNHGLGVNTFRCNRCYHCVVAASPSNFCPDCGADMRERGTDE